MKQTMQCFISTPARATASLVTLVTLWHLWLAGRVDLSVDEAHYALYGVKLALSYFDHPPMVGWLNAIPTLFSHTDTALRIIPAAFFAISCLILYRIAVRLFPDFEWIGFWSIVTLQGAIMFQLLSISMLPDTPLMIASLMVFWTLLNLRDKSTLKQWLWLGFWLGIAGLSKYTAVTLVISLILVMLVESRYDWLKDKGLWLAVLAATVLISPVLIWNAQHDWVSFLYQLNHGTHHSEWDWLRVAQTQVAQLVVYTPLLYLIGLFMAFFGLFLETNTRLLALFALPILGLFALGSGYEMSLPHWTQSAWMFLTPLVIYWIWLNWDRRWVRGFTYFGAGYAVLTTVLLSALLVAPWIPSPDNQHPTRDLHGWPEAVAKAQSYQQQYPNAQLFVSNWTQASRVAWYAYPQPVYVTDNRFDQFDIWYGNPPVGSAGILIVPSYEDLPPKTNKPGHFNQCTELDALKIEYLFNLVVTYHFFHCEGFQAVKYSGWEKELPLVQDIEKSSLAPNE